MSDLKNFLDLQRDHEKLKADYTLANNIAFEESLKYESQISELENHLIQAIAMFESCYEVLTLDDYHNYIDWIEAAQPALKRLIGTEYNPSAKIRDFIIEKEKQLRKP